MGVGDSLEAAYTLRGPLPAGRWHLVGDGIVLGKDVTRVDVRFDIVWRAAGADGGSGTVLATFSNRFVRSGSGFAATPFSADATGVAAAARAGDQLVLRISPTGGDPGALFDPNGDGANAGGAIPRIDLPR